MTFPPINGVVIMVLVGASFFSQSTRGQGQTEVPAATVRLYQLFDQEWEYQLKTYPENATYQGDRRYNDRLTDWSLAAIEARQQHQKVVLDELGNIDRNQLSPVDQLNYDLFRKEYRDAVAASQFPSYLMPVTQLRGPQLDFPQLVSFTPFTSMEDYQAYLKRLRAFPMQVDQIIILLREGIRQKWLRPAAPLRGVAEQIQQQMDTPLEKHPLYQPFRHFPEEIPESEQQKLQKAGKELIMSAVLPAYRKFYQFWTKTYYPATFKRAGIWQVPDGDAYYQNRIAYFTTTSMTAEEIHQIGLREVKRIRLEMEKIIKEVGFEGDFAAFVKFLRSDPRFYYTSAKALLIGYRDICKRIDPELVKLFGKLPRIPYGVREIPAYQAPTTYTAYYQPPADDGSRAGYFYANTYKLETRPKYEMEALTAHEAVPGHHLQIALALELKNLPEFRRHSEFTAFVEGWALYAESLGKALGLYQSPYSKFGQLTYEMWRACRLVVDTGIHSLHWTRQQAIDYLVANTAKTEHDIATEVDRYIVWPGQALAYKIGELKIKELRAKAEKALGNKFNIRKFHDKVLENGAIPLDVLERVIDDYIRDESQG